MNDIYQECPELENENYVLRFVQEEDAADLLNVYSDEKAVPFFNSDNCGGDDFHYTTYERMQEAIRYWIWEYERGGFVRWSVIDKNKKEVIGTVEIFHREAADYFTCCGLLRLDLRSDCEKQEQIYSLLSMLVSVTYDLFSCKLIATKCPSKATERFKALKQAGFIQTDQKLIGHDGTEYDHYLFRTNGVELDSK